MIDVFQFWQGCVNRLDVIENDMGDETMPSDHKKLIGRQTANSVMFAVYFLFLVWAVLWKCRAPFIGGTERVINLIPFNGNAGYETLFNFVLFVPLGFYIAAIAKKRSIIKQVFMILAVSLVFEIVQYTLAIGSSDTTDVILDTLGGGVGIFGLFLLKKLFGMHTNKAVLIVNGIITAVVLYCSVSFLVFGTLYIGRVMFRL